MITILKTDNCLNATNGEMGGWVKVGDNIYKKRIDAEGEK